MSLTSQVEKWVGEVAGLTRPAKVMWADGSKAEYDQHISAAANDASTTTRMERRTDFTAGSPPAPSPCAPPA